MTEGDQVRALLHHVTDKTIAWSAPHSLLARRAVALHDVQGVLTAAASAAKEADRQLKQVKNDSAMIERQTQILLTQIAASRRLLRKG